MRSPPLSVLASWPQPNYVDPQTRGPAGKIVGSILVTLVTLILALRLYTRRFISNGLGVDDALIIVAYIPSTAYAILGIVGETYFEWNRHVWDVEPGLFVPSLQIGLAEVMLFDISTSLTKLSMLAMIYRVTAASEDRRLNMTVLLLACLISVNGFIFLMVTIFQCSPISDYWTLSLTPQRCINEAAHLLAAGIINTVTDFILVLLPMKMIMGLQLPQKQRLIVLGLFGAGFLACAAGIVRTYFTWFMTTSADYDSIWNAWAVWLASGVELYIGIICASIPAIKPFFATYLPKVLDDTIRSHKSSIYANDMKPLRSPDSFKTFIDGPSSSSPQVPRRGQEKPPQQTSRYIPAHERSLSADLNKPLPAIRATMRYSSPHTMAFLASEDQSLRSSVDLGRDILAPPQRAGVRYSNRSTTPFTTGDEVPEDRTTVFIMYQGEEGYGRAL